MMNEPSPPTPKSCPHFRSLAHNNSFSFIKPSLKCWLCLKDGCCKKIGTHALVKAELNKFENQHKIFMDMGTFEIYCFQCDIEIIDDAQYNVYDIRKLALQEDKQQQRTLYGANIEYPMGFQKQKQGISGTLGNELCWYTDASIQLLAHISPFYQISQDINLQQIHDEFLLQTFSCINKIRSGLYRIVNIKKVQKSILSKEAKFHNYSFKLPVNFIYEVLRSFSQELQYKVKNKLIKENKEANEVNEVKEEKIENEEIYSPMKQLFGGQFIWNLCCQNCGKNYIKKAQFECLRLQPQNPNSQKSPKKLQHLLDQIFNFQNLFTNTFPTPIKCPNQKPCPKYLTPLSTQCTTKLPNILLLQFIDQDGTNVQLPDTLDLNKYKNGNTNIKENYGINIEEPEYFYHYVGAIGKIGKRYITHARVQRDNGERDFGFEGCLIREDANKPNKVCLAVYKMQSSIKNKGLAKNIESSAMVDVQCYAPLPDFFNFYLSDLARIQPVISPFICPHGYQAPKISSKSKQARKIPPSIYEYLVEQFGGVKIKISKDNDFCEICAKKIQIMTELKASERQMAKFADQLSTKKSKVCINIKWFQQWKRYLYEKNERPYHNGLFERPGLINNKEGLYENGQIDETKYKKVSPEVWYFFKKFYGGGPLIAKNPMQPSLALSQAVDLRWQKIKNLLKQLQDLK